MYSICMSKVTSDLLSDLQERITPDELAKHGFPKPKEVRVSKGIDSAGEEAFYIFLVFPDKTPDKSLAWNKVEPMVSWVRNLILSETDGNLWAYVKVKRRKEMAGGLN
jgi:hypothetical protein